MCLAQFSTHYTFTRKVPKHVTFVNETGASDDKEDKSTKFIYDSDVRLPRYLKLSGDKEFMRLRAFPAVLRIHRSDRKEGHEQHYSVLLLYTPWSNEEANLKRTHNECIEQYQANEEMIASVKKQIFLGEDTVNMLDTDLEENRPVPIYDQIDPQREQELDDDREEGFEDDPRFGALDYGNAFNDNEESPKLEEFKYKQIVVPSKEELTILTRRLVPEQMRILLKIVHVCKEVKKARKAPHERPRPIRIIVVGGAGVGKSLLIKVVTAHGENILREEGDHPHKPRILVCAPTGKAATLIDGQTIHGAFSFQFGTSSAHNSLGDKKRAEMREMLSELRLIIIDEVSLLGVDMMYRIHLRLTEIFQCEDLFANISVIFVGDLMQLPPVNQSYIFSMPSDGHFEAFNGALSLWESFEPYELVHNHRQKEEMEWANILNQIRVGEVTQEAEKILRSRTTQDPWLDDNAMHVFYTNKEVAAHNEKMLKKLDTPSVTIHSKKINPKGFTPKISEWGTVQKSNFMDVLELKVGARVSLVYNINTLDELVNGALGTVVGFEKVFGNVKYVIVAFDSEKCGKEQRLKYSVIAEKYKDVNGTPIKRQTLDYQIESKKGRKHAAKASVENFPLILCWGSTAHKMQGITVKAGSKLICHWHKKFKQGMAYVMLGRCESLSDIYIAGDFDPKGIKADTAALIETRRIREIATRRSEDESRKQDNSYTFGFLNVRSFAAHAEDIETLLKLKKFDVIALGETWLHPGQVLQMDGWFTKSENVGKGKGLGVLSKSSTNIIKTCSAEKMSAAVVKSDQGCCIYLYLSKGYDWQVLKDMLDDWIDSNVPTIVMGDVNWHWSDNGKNSMKAYMKSKKFDQIVKRATHEEGHIIDHVYISPHFQNDSVTLEQQSVTFSDHDLMSISISTEIMDV